MKVDFRPVTQDDLELLIAWRSHPEVYAEFDQDGPLKWESYHERWQSVTDHRDWIILVRESDHWRDVGVVEAYDLDSNTPEVAVYIGEIPLWGNGIGTEAVSFVVEWLSDWDYSGARARINETNIASRRVFEKLGFHSVDQTDDGEHEYRLRFD